MAMVKRTLLLLAGMLQRSQESSVDLAAAPWTFALPSSGRPRSRSVFVLALAAFYLMVAKSGIVESLIVMALALALGAVAATRTKLTIRASSTEAPGGASARV
jgi:hypothetical protein